jgi:hypothetical protein
MTLQSKITLENNRVVPTNENITTEEQEYKEYKHREHKRYLDTKKVDLLNNYIFQSMAYLTYFFKYVSTSKALNKIFENDVKDLLGIRVKDPESDEYAFLFADLLSSILSTEFQKKGVRLGLIHILQEISKENVEEYIDSTQKNENIKNIILGDFDRVSSWTAIFSENMDQTAGVRAHRTLNFNDRLSLREGEGPI